MHGRRIDKSETKILLNSKSTFVISFHVFKGSILTRMKTLISLQISWWSTSNLKRSKREDLNQIKKNPIKERVLK